MEVVCWAHLCFPHDLFLPCLLFLAGTVEGDDELGAHGGGHGGRVAMFGDRETAGPNLRSLCQTYKGERERETRGSTYRYISPQSMLDTELKPSAVQLFLRARICSYSFHKPMELT